MAQGYTGAHFIDFTKFLLLAGRTGTTNDASISTSTIGTLSGSTASPGTLRLRGTSNATPGLSLITFQDNLTAIGANTLVATQLAPSLTLDNGNAIFVGHQIAGTWNITTTLGNPGSGSAVQFSPTIQNSPSGTSRVFGTFYHFLATPTYTSLGTVTNTASELTDFNSIPAFTTSSTATMTATALTAYKATGFQAGNGMAVTTRRGFWFNPVTTTGTGTITNDVAVECDGLPAATNPISLRSTGQYQMRHAGPARFGLSGAPQSGSVMDIEGGITYAVTAGPDSAYTILTSDNIIQAAITLARTYTLPAIASAGVGKRYIIIHTTGAAILTIARGSTDTINAGATTYAPANTLYRIYYCVAVTTTNWAIASFIP